MVEMPRQIYFLAAAVVVVSLTVLGFFLREAIATSNSYRHGVTLYQQRDYKGAEVAFRKVISRHPSNDMVHLLLGDALMQQDKLEEAITEFRELSRRAPKNCRCSLEVGDCFSEARQARGSDRSPSTSQGFIQSAAQYSKS